MADTALANSLFGRNILGINQFFVGYVPVALAAHKGLFLNAAGTSSDVLFILDEPFSLLVPIHFAADWTGANQPFIAPVTIGFAMKGIYRKLRNEACMTSVAAMHIEGIAVVAQRSVVG
jgi:hypothetical protein